MYNTITTLNIWNNHVGHCSITIAFYCKSTVAKIFEILGIPVFNADMEAKKLMEQNLEIRSAVQKQFGPETYTGGKLNRSILSAQVFSNPYLLDKLNSIVHPITIEYANSWGNRQTSPYVIKEAALVFEAGSGANLAYIVGVYAPKALRIHRVMQRDQFTREQVIDRMNRQISEEIKMKLCDYILVNDEQQLLTPQVLQLHETFLRLAGQQ